jgi:hypothetical protein
MAQSDPDKQVSSFRVPNSIVQGITTATPADLNRLSSFQMITLFGLMAHVSAKHPEKEVRLKVCEILEIVQVSKNVSHAVDRKWTTDDGEVHQKRYTSSRYSPTHLTQVHAALLALHGQAVAIHYFDQGSGKKIKDHIVHILDSFGYCYQANGQKLDVDDLPPDLDRINVGTDERPVLKVRRRTLNGHQYERPTAVTFRINRELAREITNARGTIGFTLFAHRLFALFRDFMRSPAAIRLVVLTLRQTQADFLRILSQMLDELGFDISHRDRAVEDMVVVLDRLRDAGIVTEFSIDHDEDRIRIIVNRNWFREPGDG